MVRDDEIKRLRNYAKGLGCKVIIVNVKKLKEDYAVCDFGKHKITVYKSPRMTKTEIVFSLIHEIAHYKSYIKKNRKVSNTDSDNHTKFFHQVNPPPYIRYYVYCSELNDQKYWDEIIKDCNIKIPKKRIELQKELDMSSYETLFLFGEDYTKCISNEFKKLIKRNYK